MLFYSYFKTLVGKEVSSLYPSQASTPSTRRFGRSVHFAAYASQVTVELKNDLSITGVLHSVDQYLNVKLNSVKVVNESKYPHMVCSLANECAYETFCSKPEWMSSYRMPQVES